MTCDVFVFIIITCTIIIIEEEGVGGSLVCVRVHLTMPIFGGCQNCSNTHIAPFSRRQGA